jgi:hypothetical protein
MNGHPEYLDLVAASIDFDLTDEEFGRLSTHLARCPDCRRAADELRGDAAAIAAYPAARLAPARSEQILRAALRTPRSQPRWGLLAVAALLTTLGGGILFAGFQLVNDEDPAPSEPPPSLVAEASAPPSPTPAEDTAEPGAPDGGNPPAIDVPEPSREPPEMGAIDFEFPLPFTRAVSSVRVAPLPDGRLWVSFTDENGTVLALLDQEGDGGPAEIPGVEDCVPLAVADGSVRLLCASVNLSAEECESGCPDEQILAYSEDFDELPGFPVQLESWQTGSLDRRGARVIGSNVVVGTLDAVDEELGTATARLLTIGGDGSLTEGFPLDDVAFCCAVGPDGIGYASSAEPHDDGTQTTTLSAIGMDGLVDGWPLAVEGTASGPAFAPDGDVYLTSWIDDGSRITRVHDGTPVSSVDRLESIAWDPRFDGPVPPLVNERGQASVMIDDRMLRLDGAGTSAPGWPYEPDTSWAERGTCAPQDTGCQPWLEQPRLAPRGLVYALESGPDGKGERITVVNPDGSIRSGWPVTLQRPGATWDSVTIGENRIAYAVAVEPEPKSKASISILAFAPNSERLWIRTLIEP